MQVVPDEEEYAEAAAGRQRRMVALLVPTKGPPMPPPGPAGSRITTRRAPLRTVLFTLVAQAIVLWGVLRDRSWMRAIRDATGGWVDPNLPAGALVFLLSIVPFVFLRARLRPRDIGLDAARLGAGAVAVVALWVATQLLLALLAGLAWGELRPAPLWSRPSAPAGPLGFLLAMLVIITALEEATFRGFVLPQVWLRLRGSPRVRTWGAVTASAALFALIHVPNRSLVQGLAGPALATSLAALLVGGIFMAIIYLRTANLWVTGGIHAFMNAPTPLFDAPLPPMLVMMPLVVALLVFWPRLTGGRGRDLLAPSEIVAEPARTKARS